MNNVPRPLLWLIPILVVGAMFFHWSVNRVYVPIGYSLQLQYKGPLLLGSAEPAEPGQFADPDKGQQGVLKKMLGPGRHFYCPIWWVRTLVRDQEILPGQVAIVRSKLGKDLPGDEFLVDGDLGKTEYKGILRKAFGPGRYRYNPYAYEFEVVGTVKRLDNKQEKTSGWVNIPIGYVGVVTNMAANPTLGTSAGVQDKVLPPGLYLLNPKEQETDLIEIGLRELSVVVTKQTDRAGKLILDESGEPTVTNDNMGIGFPSNDGFRINMDFTAIWGVMPDQAAMAVQQFGTIKAVQNKFVEPQIENICRNQGSKKGAVELLVGESRQKFQDDVFKEFHHVMEGKNITLLYGLVRHIYIPTEVRIPIQNANIADELKLTRDQEQITAQAEATLREAERKVELESERIHVETDKLVANVMAEGQKKSEETRAQTVQLVAAIDKQTAALEAQAQVVLGQAKADAEKMLQQAQAEKFRLAVEAFGSGEAYNNWVFATGLPDDVELKLFYAGEGTFWTDLQGFMPTMMGRQVQQAQQATSPEKAKPQPSLQVSPSEKPRSQQPTVAPRTR